MGDRRNKLEWPNEYWLIETGPVKIDPSKMLRIHGYRDLAKVRPVIRKAADDIALVAEGLIAPEAYSRKIEVMSYGDDFMKLADGTVFENVDFGNVLDNSPSVVDVELTVERALDEAVVAAMDKFEPLDALFLETAGWLGVEWTTRSFVNHLTELVLEEKLRPTRRMGPGYSYKIDGGEEMWSLEDQRHLFSVFDDVELPVRLLESCAMMPKMSRSGVYGLVPSHG